MENSGHHTSVEIGGREGGRDGVGFTETEGDCLSLGPSPVTDEVLNIPSSHLSDGKQIEGHQWCAMDELR